MVPEEEEINEMSREVFKTIFVNDFEGLQKIYAKHDLGTDILDDHGMTPLQHAAYKGNEQIVRWLLDRVSVGVPSTIQPQNRLYIDRFLVFRVPTSIPVSTSTVTPPCISVP